MGVALDHLAAAFKLTFEFADAPPELMVKLALLDQLLRLSGQRKPYRSEFIGELSDLHVLRASSASFGVFNSLLDLLKVAEDSASTHLVKGKEVVAVNQHEQLISKE